MRRCLSSYLYKTSKVLVKFYTFIIVFVAIWFWYIRSVYWWDLIISEFFYNSGDVWVEISNIWPLFSGNINLVWLWPIVSSDITLDTNQTILIWNNLSDIDVGSIWLSISWVWLILDDWWVEINLSTDWNLSDKVILDIERLNHILDNQVSYQKVITASGVWQDGYAYVRQNMTNIDIIANPSILVFSGDIWTEDSPFDSWLSYGDIQIIEVWPSSGNCMNEFIKIRSNIYYSWLVSFYGLWSSDRTIDYYLDLSPWQELVITDDISWLIPWPDILVWPTITLTNGWEQLKVIASGTLLDDIIYSNLKWIQSLFYTSNSGEIRLFQTNWLGTPANKCNQVNFTWWIWLCDIDPTIDYIWTGIYDINLDIIWQYDSLCNSGSIRILNGITWSIDTCDISFQNLLGSNKIEFLQYSGVDLICKDIFIFSSNYDIWYVNQYYCPVNISSWSNSPSTPSENICKNNPTHGALTNCHVKYQWSTVWFFAWYAFNTIAHIEGKDIQNNNKKYNCYRDMWDGNTLSQCNPSGYKYNNPGVYIINLTITDNSSNYYCRTSSFVNYPLKGNMDDDHANYYDLYEYVLDFCSDYSSDDNYPNNIDIIWSFCSGFYDSGFVTSNITPQYTWSIDTIIYSVLPNPVWSDSLYEEIVLQNLLTSTSYLDWLSLHIWSKKINLSWSIWPDWFKSILWWLGLVNNGMCIYLKKENLLLDEFCYDSVKEWQIVTLSGQIITWEKDLLDKDNDWLSWDILDTDLDKVWQYIIDLLSLENILWDIWSDITIDKELNSLLTSVRLVQDDYTICDEWWPQHCKISTSKATKSKPKSTMSKYQIEATVYKHKYYLYKNFNSYLYSQISDWRPFVTEDPSIISYFDQLEQLDSRIWSWYVYTSKDNRSYKYFNNFKQSIQKEENITIWDVIYPSLVDYVDQIKTYYINKELIDNIKNLK